MTDIRSDKLFYCPRCTCEFCTAQRRVVERYNQRVYELERRDDERRLEALSEKERVAELNLRHQAATWMLVLGAPRSIQHEQLGAVAGHMEIPASHVRAKAGAYGRVLELRISALVRDHTAPIERLRKAGALPTGLRADTPRWTFPTMAYLPETCTICGGTYPEGRHCKRNSCRRKRGRT